METILKPLCRNWPIQYAIPVSGFVVDLRSGDCLADIVLDVCVTYVTAWGGRLNTERPRAALSSDRPRGQDLHIVGSFCGWSLEHKAMPCPSPPLAYFRAPSRRELCEVPMQWTDGHVWRAKAHSGLACEQFRLL